MANQDDRQHRNRPTSNTSTGGGRNYDDQDDDQNQKGPQPWNLARIVKIEKRDGSTKDEFINCGVAWPMKEREGFIFDIYFALPEGARMALMPRPPKNGGGR